MADLKKIQENIHRRRQEFKVADDVYYQALQQVALSQKIGDSDLQTNISQKRQIREDARLNLHAAINLLTETDTQQKLLTQIDADIPFLLLPLRLEARYVTFRHVVRNLNPDDWIDNSQLNSGFEQEEEGNWTYQVPQLNGGLFNTLASQVKNQQIKPKSNRYIELKPDEEVLCIRFYPDEIFKYAHEPSLMPAEWEAGKAFWEQIFTNSEPQERTWLNFSAVMSPARAAWIVRMSQPMNYSFGQPLPAQPKFPENPLLKDGAYTLPPTTHLLPERMVVRLYTDSGEFKEFTGEAIPEPIRLGLDPTDDPFDDHSDTSEFSEEKGTLKSPEYLEWIQSLEVAEKQGLAIRIDLKQNPEFKDGVAKIFVLGLKLSATETESSQLLNDHFENCLYKENGMAILSQGTPTNNFEDQKSGFNIKEIASLAYFNSTFKAPRQHPKGWENDESYLRRFLGLEENFRFPNGDQTDIHEAKTLNNMLWHSTWGYYLLQFFTPAILESKREMLRKFFNQYVTGRGLLPVFRINHQPYGIVPTTNWSLWQYKNGNEEEDFLSKVWSDFLSKLKTHWNTASADVNAVSNSKTSGGNLDEGFLDMLSQTASSGQFQGQILTGAGFKSILQKLLDEVNGELTPILNMESRQESQLANVNAEITQKEGEIQENNLLITSLNVFVNTPFLKGKFPQKAKERTALMKKNTVLNSKANSLKSRRTTLQSAINSALSKKNSLLNSRTQLTAAIQSLNGISITNVHSKFKALPSQAFENVTIGQQLQLPNCLIDSLPLSEDRSAEKIAGKSWNYLEWLLKAKLSDIWNNQINSAPEGEGDEESQADKSLFALLTRQSLLRALLENHLKTTESNPGLWLLKAKDFELEHLESSEEIQFNPQALNPKNILHQQYEQIVAAFKPELTDPITLKTNRQEYLGDLDTFNFQEWLQNSGDNPNLNPLKDLEKAFQIFKDIPTARLKRLFTEHLDLCTYRLDAWMSGLIYQRLDKQRGTRPQGIQLGSFGYLQGLKSKKPRDIVVLNVEPNFIAANSANFEKAAIPVVNTKAALDKGIELTSSTEQAFFYIGENANPRIWLNLAANKVEADSLINKHHSDGFIHMPSLTHATTAAIMRAGYLAHVADTHTETMSINLTAPRVRNAMQMIDGMQAGISLAELLGHLFERSLHDQLLDGFRFEFRKAFPLKEEGKEDGKSTLMASLDGLALLKAYQSNPSSWLKALKNDQGQLLTISPSDKERLTAIAKSLEADYLDSTGDLLLTESVFQTTKGNTDKAAAALRSLNTGGQSIMPDFIQVPQKGHGLTHKVGIIFPTLAKTDKGNIWTSKPSPRSALAPSMNKWLARQLPDPSIILISVTLPDGNKIRLKLSEIGIEPIDLINLLPVSFRQGAISALHLWVQTKVLSLPQFKDEIPETSINIDFKDRADFDQDEVSIHEVNALILNLKKILELSRPILPTDLSLLGSDNGKLNLELLEDALKSHIENSSSAALLSQTLRKTAQQLWTSISNNEPVASQRNAAVALCLPLIEASLFGIEEAGSEGSISMDQERFVFLVEKAELIAITLEKRLTGLKQILTELSPDENQRFQQLQKAATEFLGKETFVYPELVLTSSGPLQTAIDERKKILNTESETVDNWIREAALVRKPLKHWRQLSLLRELFPTVTDAFREPIVTQLPFLPQVPWIGNSLKEFDLESIEPELRPNTSILLETPEDFTVTESFSGILLDEWSEFIPSSTTDTGLAFQYDQPNTEPPQVMLLAVSPQEGGNWQWEFLMGAVEDALQMSKSRLVTLDKLKGQNKIFEEILPAVVLPFLNNNANIPETELIKPKD
ncbi:hypothetical protein SYJ56_18920 [Algoriphagus sp. D3-2-R+10]|uniref:hypothetical protein n=1 Tax=Algoriphagus aurantiacus TaxID=3103948 RepID=UPI002B3C8965|nr:hypothetical protein [Algoriphagus sp. D3-2-R+10]MEB2777394.1 hypothetical protein [Algoriphagus sp. D3-2-R+10]